MKKPDLERLAYLNRRAKRRQRILTVRKAQRRRAALKVVPRFRSRTHGVNAPKVFRLNGTEEERTSLLQFLHRMEYLLAQGHKVRINYDRTVELFPDGTLLFVATLEKLLAQYPARISCNYPKHPVVEQLFQHIGVLNKLGNSARAVVTAENVRHWHYVQGTVVDLSGLETLFTGFAAKLGEETGAGLFDSVSEAITNVVQHAYEGLPEGAIKTEARWWMFAQQRDGKLDVVISDLGIGIPRSLREKEELADVLPGLIRRLRKRQATGLIEMAVESSRSRTKLPYRGKGLPDMLKFSKACNVGFFLVHSANGTFMYNSNTKREIASDYDTAIPGTLINWQLELATT